MEMKYLNKDNSEQKKREMVILNKQHLTKDNFEKGNLKQSKILKGKI